MKGIIQKAAPKTSFFQPRGASSVSPEPQALAPAQPGSSGVLQATESITQGRHVDKHENILTSDGDAGDEVGAGYAGGGVVPNQRTSAKAEPKTTGDKQPVPKAKPKPKAPGRARPQSTDPKQTRLAFK